MSATKCLYSSCWLLLNFFSNQIHILPSELWWQGRAGGEGRWPYQLANKWRTMTARHQKIEMRRQTARPVGRSVGRLGMMRKIVGRLDFAINLLINRWPVDNQFQRRGLGSGRTLSKCHLGEEEEKSETAQNPEHRWISHAFSEPIIKMF